MGILCEHDTVINANQSRHDKIKSRYTVCLTVGINLSAYISSSSHFFMYFIQAWKEPRGEWQRLKQTWCELERKWHSEVSLHPAASPVPTWHANWYKLRNQLLSQRERGQGLWRSGPRWQNKRRSQMKRRQANVKCVRQREDIREGGGMKGGG